MIAVMIPCFRNVDATTTVRCASAVARLVPVPVKVPGSRSQAREPLHHVQPHRAWCPPPTTTTSRSTMSDIPAMAVAAAGEVVAAGEVGVVGAVPSSRTVRLDTIRMECLVSQRLAR